MGKLEQGTFVYYNSPHGSKQFGRVKRVTPDGFHAFVVFNCNKDWTNYKDYTASRCEVRRLTLSKNN